MQSSPTLARGPLDSTTRPTVLVTRPQRGRGSVRRTMSRYRPSEKPSDIGSYFQACGLAIEESARELLELRVD